ncbi:DUF4398 domain-containing protein [Bdellovibrio reynosensis]|uniref:DUF4398 domain-containing protein n=1 Tax=Bdellovibrio reynosensis TaxID=2835041 RepID=A0ABY4C8N0_9BACT|nr:DUF4398 domain-containing protein [Bdellovibrio reynosensis]UOE99847.1 DUF4398 domain-containing protein [Bdellovibrio reynosensis]
MKGSAVNLLKLIIVVLVTVIVSCQTVPAPVEDYSLARAALDAARSVQAARHSPGYWHQAEEAYRKGRIYFEDRDFSKAKEQFVRARVAAEKAENSARLIRQRTGDVL